MIQNTFEQLSSEEEKIILATFRNNNDFDEEWDSHFESPEEEKSYMKMLDAYMKEEREAERRSQINLYGGDYDWEAQKDLEKHDFLFDGGYSNINN